MPFRDFFERWGDEIPPLNFPSLTPTLSHGRNRFIPIPYNCSCTIRLAPGWGAYYHFTYSSFPSDTTLPMFGDMFVRDAALALADADRILGERGWRTPRSSGDRLERVTVTVPPGTTVPLHTIVGNRAITGIRVSLDLPEPPEDQRLLRELALSIRWDGEDQSSVWSPLGNFFGAASGVCFYRALPLGCTDGGFPCHWFMPFAERAELTLANDGDVPRTLSFSIYHRPLERDASELLRFHAKWHREAFLERSAPEGRAIDWPLLLAEGQGRFCGVHLHVWNRWDEPLEPPESWWYGRWDRKTVD